MSKKCCAPLSECQCVIVQSLPVGMNALRPLFAQIVGDIPITLDIGTSCENPIFSNICSTEIDPVFVNVVNSITATLDVGSSCLDPIFSTICNSDLNPVPVTFSGGLDSNVNVEELAGNPIDLGFGNADVGTQRMVIADDNIVQVRISQASEGVWNRVFSNTGQVGGNTVDIGNGVTNTGTQRFTLSNDSTGQVKLTTGSEVIILAQGGAALTSTANALNVNLASSAGSLMVPVNVAQLNGTTILDGNGIVAPGVQRVTIANNSTGVLASITALNIFPSTATAGQSGPLIQGAVTTAAPTYVSGNTNPLSLDTSGALRITGTIAAAIIGTVVTATAGQIPHDDPATTTDPLLIGGYAFAAAPTSVSTDGDAVNGWFLRNGAQATVLTAAGALIGGDAANGLDVDVTRMSALVASSAIIGKVGIDQTTPGTTNLVAAGQSGSWTVTANAGTNLNTSLLATEATLAKLTLSQGSVTAAQTGPLIQGAVTTSAPAYTTAQTSPLSLDPSGNLRVLATLAAGSIVIGTVDIDQATPGTTNGVSIAYINSTAAAAGNGASSAGVLRVAQVNDGTGVLASITNLAYAQGSTTATQTGPLIQGAVTTSNPTYTDTQTAPLSLDATGALRITGTVAAAIVGLVNITRLLNGQINHDDAIGSAAPVFIGGYASAAAPTSVSTDGDAVNGWFLLNGAQATVLTAAGALIGGDATNGLDVDVTRMAALVAGAAIIGKVGIDQTTPGTTNAISIAQLGANTVSTGNGGTGTGVLRVAQVNDGTGVLASITALNLAQGSTTSGQTGPLILGAVTTAAPSYTTAQSSPLSLDTAGSLRVTGTLSIAANSSVNVNQIAGTTTSVNNGAVDNGTQRVTIANNSTGILAGVTTVTTVTTVAAVTAITNALPAGTNAIGVVSTKTALTGASPGAASVGVTSAAAVSSNASRKGLEVYNTSSATISLAFGAAAVLNSGITLPPGGFWAMDEYSFTTAEVRGIASAAASNLGYQEYT